MNDFTATIKALKILGKMSRDDRKAFVDHTVGLTEVSKSLTIRERSLLVKHLLNQRPDVQLGMAEKVTEILGEKPYTPATLPSE